MTNQIIHDCYSELNSFLPEEESDPEAYQEFIEKGPETLQKYTRREGFFDGWEPEEPEEGDYTRTLLMDGGEPDEMAMIYMQWPSGHELPPHRHHGKPCFEELIEGQLEITEFEETELENGDYLLEPRDPETVNQGETAAVDPRYINTHEVVAKKFSGSIHVYPASYGECVIFDHLGGNRHRPRTVDLEIDKDVRDIII